MVNCSYRYCLLDSTGSDGVRVPANCRFELDDMEQPWMWSRNSFDFIFARDLIYCIRDWPKLIDQCYT
jgi:hypothetical protein